MHRASLLSRFHGLVGPLKPPLRVIGLAYTGLGGMLAMVLVVSVALVPVAPVLQQQVVEPARQVVSGIVQPTSDVVAILLGGSLAVVVDQPVPQARPPSSLFSDPIGVAVTIADPVQDMPPPVAVRAVAAAVFRAPVVEAEPAQPEAVDEITGLEPSEVSAIHAIQALAQATPAAILQIASVEAPKPLPTLPPPPETALQVKARMDAANQAAIDAAKAAQARAKADADTANNAAIAANAARKATASATVVATSAPTPAETAAPTAVRTNPIVVVTPTATTQSKAAANAGNQAAIDAAKLAQTRAKAPTGTPLTKVTATPTAQPTSLPIAPSTPVTQPPAPTTVLAESQTQIQELSADELLLENTPIDLAAEPSDGSVA